MQVEEGLVERILNTFSLESLPLVEFALTLMWAQRAGGRLTHAAYDAIGGVEQALARYAEEQFGELGSAERQRAEAIFVQLVSPGEGTEDTRRLATRSDVGEESWDLVARLATARLVVTGRDHTTGEETVEIVHEALIRNWGRLREWMRAHRAFRTWQERLRATVRQWEASSRNDGVLLRGAPLAEAEEWLERRADAVVRREREFVLASRGQQEQEQKRWQQLYEELKALNERLEQRVEERTAEILRMNEELEDRVRRRTFELEEANEELAAARDEALKASLAKDTFLAMMSHELRTPLNAITGYAELLIEDAEDNGYGQIIPDVRKIHTAGIHLLTLINDLLDLAKSETGRIQLDVTEFPLGEFLGCVQAMASPLAELRRNELTVEAQGELGRMRADEKRVRQILLNLLSNACKFTEQGRVTLRVAREDRGGREWVRFVVEDTGIGISAEKVSRLFQPFEKGDGSTTRKYGGTGLGLAISHRLCQMMGGTIEVVSEVGKGSTFTVRLPAMAGARAPVS